MYILCTRLGGDIKYRYYNITNAAGDKDGSNSESSHKAETKFGIL